MSSSRVFHFISSFRFSFFSAFRVLHFTASPRCAFADVFSKHSSHSPGTRKSRTRTASPPCAFADVLSNHSSHSPDTRKSRMRTASPPCAFVDVFSNHPSDSSDTRKSRMRIFLIFVFFPSRAEESRPPRFLFIRWLMLLPFSLPWCAYS